MKKQPLKQVINGMGYSIIEAEKIIRAGKVMVNNETIFMPNEKVLPDANIIIKEQKEWVSRGAYKLLKAIDAFKLDFNNKVILDIGASKGGFTQVALRYGAKKIYALDVGTNQLDYNLRINPRVVVQEKTNLKSISNELFEDKIEIVVCDVSFIGLNEVFKVIKEILEAKSQVIVLIKPQFEASKKYVSPGGFVELEHHNFLINKVKKQASEYFDFIDLIESPIKGNISKNIEYLALFERK
ncbi:TlyA family RNA methyltransferase [Mycoplasma iguanae]|uniref:TlyA family RNA methyltransferase n=1 Tax=Mycoplasma iguanae TaxID=292461 RepID=A0ABY5RBG1_9MOLU|nr:TlyA family RNA methyltransferase [Mycoplasma iguanae]UVD81945.1 TlyA family RNA methyltransferase [Mycoplasma iguanae]